MVPITHPDTIPLQLVIYAEGTRSTPEKQLESQKFCRERNLPVFNVSSHDRALFNNDD